MRSPVGACALVLAGCISHWETQVAPTATVVQVSGAHEYRITRSDGSRVALFRPAVVGDSLVGRQAPVPAWPDTSARVAIGLTDIRAIAVKEPDVMASVLVGTVVTVGGLILLLRESGLPTGD